MPITSAPTIGRRSFRSGSAGMEYSNRPPPRARRLTPSSFMSRDSVAWVTLNPLLPSARRRSSCEVIACRDRMSLIVACRAAFVIALRSQGTSSVPTPSCVKISSSSECLTRPSMIWTLPTPASSAPNADLQLGQHTAVDVACLHQFRGPRPLQRGQQLAVAPAPRECRSGRPASRPSAPRPAPPAAVSAFTLWTCAVRIDPDRGDHRQHVLRAAATPGTPC